MLAGTARKRENACILETFSGETRRGARQRHHSLSTTPIVHPQLQGHEGFLHYPLLVLCARRCCYVVSVLRPQHMWLVKYAYTRYPRLVGQRNSRTELQASRNIRYGPCKAAVVMQSFRDCIRAG